LSLSTKSKAKEVFLHRLLCEFCNFGTLVSMENFILFCSMSGTVDRAGSGAGLIPQGVQKVRIFTPSDTVLSNAVILDNQLRL
jgi:hypothetical protein